VLHEPVRKVVVERKLKVDGVDISVPNVDICKQRIKDTKMDAYFTACVQDARSFGEEGAYDALLFMESFPVMSKPLFVDILKNTQRLLKPSGVNFLYHNLTDPKKVGLLSIMVAKVMKPSMKLLMGIDFGRLTTVPEMDDCLRDALPGSPPHEDEILLAATGSEMKIDFSGVTNLWHRFWGKLIMGVMKASDERMEQHLITIGAPKK